MDYTGPYPILQYYCIDRNLQIHYFVFHIKPTLFRSSTQELINTKVHGNFPNKVIKEPAILAMYRNCLSYTVKGLLRPISPSI